MPTEVGKVTLISNGDEVLSDDFPSQVMAMKRLTLSNKS